MTAIPNELIECFKRRSIEDVKFFVKWLFPTVRAVQNITDMQAYIVKRIAFSETKRLSISAFTRYGKSQFVAVGIAVYILINENKSVKFIGPTDDQAAIIKNYMSELILNARGGILLHLSDLSIEKKEERLKAEASQRRMTFKNGCEYAIVTAHGQGFSAMGKGGSLIVMDEASLISRDAYAKIVRMLGDDPVNSTLVELYNPWDRDTKAFEHSISPRFERIQIDYRIGLKEGRITEDFVQEMREDMTPLEFTVLYESQFPDESEDSLHKLSHINRAEGVDFNLYGEMIKLLRIVQNKYRHIEAKVNKAREELKRYEIIVSCDPADKGLDFSVMMWGIVKDKQYYELLGVWSEAKSESMALVGKIITKAKEVIPKEVKGHIHIDCIGLGTGALSRLREIKNEQQLDNITVKGCHFGEAAMKKNEFQNKKAENHFRLAMLLAEGRISFKNIVQDKTYVKFKNEMMAMKWEITSSEKKRIIDPDKSPDFVDSCVYFIFKDKKELAVEFI